MTLRQLSKTHFLPEEVQEVIWGFGWHLNLGAITVLQCIVQERGTRTVHCIYRAFVVPFLNLDTLPGGVDVDTLPGGVDVDAYKAILGIPLGLTRWANRCRGFIRRPPASRHFGWFANTAH